MKYFLCLMAMCLASYAMADGEGETKKEAVVPEDEAAKNDQVFLTNVVEHGKADDKVDDKAAGGKPRTRRSVAVDFDLDLDLAAAGPLGYAHQFGDGRVYADVRDSVYGGLRRPYALRRPNGFADNTFGLLSGSALRRPNGFADNTFGLLSGSALRRPNGFADSTFGLLSGSALRRPNGFADSTFGLLSGSALRRPNGFADSTFGLLPASSIPGSALLRSPAVVGSSGYYYGPRPAVVADADGYYYNANAAVDAVGGSGYYATGNGVTEWNFVNFYNSFRPLQALKTNDNVFVRNYFRYGSFDDCLSDFERLQLNEVRTVDATAVLGDYDYLQLAGVAQGASGYLAGVPRGSAVGYVGVLKDSPYKVLALRSGCQLDDFPGFHDCIVFSGATYPYASTVRRFVYVQQQQQVLAVEPSFQAAYTPAQAYYQAAAYGNVRVPAVNRPVGLALGLQ